MRRNSILVVLVAAFCFTTAEVNASPYNSVVVYGDSLSDNGNLYAATGYPGAPYYDGRRSDGPVAVEYLAQRIGVPLIDCAWIGATTGVGNYGDGGSVTGLGTYGLPGMTTVYDGTKGMLGPYLSDGLFVVWGGPNDILAPSPLDTNYGAIITRAVANEVAIIHDLIGMGTKTILAPGMPDLGLTPYFQSLGPVAAAGATWFSDTFNANLQANLPPSVLYFDTAGLMRSVVSNPVAYGFTNVTDACFDGTAVCADPSQYMFFDDFHPTTATHAILGKNFAAATAVPEPSTLLFFFTGLGSLVLLQRRKSH